jgi:putative peptidoglycan lipid II flippase
MIANMVLNLLLVLPLVHYWNVGHLGLALATSIAACLNAGLLLRGLLRDAVFRFQPGWPGYMARLLLATAGMAVALLALNPDHAAWLSWGWEQRASEIIQLCLVGLVAYLAVHLLLGTRLRHLREPSAI